MYRELLSIVYPVFFVLVLPTQVLLIYLILRYSPKYLKTLKCVLFYNCVTQTVSVVFFFLLQVRQVSHLRPMEIWCYGLMRHYDAIISYCMYFISQSSILMSSVLIFFTIYLKYEAAINLKQAKTRKYIVMFSLLTPVFITLGAELHIIISHALPSAIQEDFRIINSNVTDHSVIGYVTLQTVSSLLIFFIISGSVIILPPIGFYIRRRILHHLNSNVDRSSSLKKFHNRSFINGLTLQAFLPLICYMPIFACFFVLIGTKSEFLFEQYFLGFFSLLPTFFDPYITLYSVTPYRKQIRTWLGMEKSDPVVMVTVQSQMI